MSEAARPPSPPAVLASPAPAAPVASIAEPVKEPEPAPPLREIGEPCTTVAIGDSTECKSGICQTQAAVVPFLTIPVQVAGTFCTIACTQHADCTDAAFNGTCGARGGWGGGLVGGPDLFCRAK